MKTNFLIICLWVVALCVGFSLMSCTKKSNIITIPVSTGNQTSADGSYGGPVTLPEPAPGRLIAPVPVRGGSVNTMPKATVFKIEGKYADHVAVTLGPDGNLSYFPAPSDISAASVPVALGDGWYLNCQGIGANSVFTKWTFEEYKALSKVPSPDEIKAAIIPGARIEDFRTLPVTASEARNMTPEELIKLL